MSWLFASGGQSSAASASVLPMNIQGSFCLILQSKELLRDFSSTTVQKHPFFGTQPPYGSTLTSVHDYWKNHTLIVRTFVSKVMSLLFNMLLRFVIAFLPRSKHLSWLQSSSAVILEPKKIKSVTICIFSPSICYEVMGLDVMIFVF